MFYFVDRNLNDYVSRHPKCVFWKFLISTNDLNLFIKKVIDEPQFLNYLILFYGPDTFQVFATLKEYKEIFDCD